MKYQKRLLENKLRQLGQHFSTVVLTGARQVGKSTLLKHILPGAQHITFDPVIDVDNARRDPELFLDHLKTPVILDEIQYAPELLSVIKRRVDENKMPGQYWLTGSQNLSLLKNVSESLAGRAALQSLYPMTLSERYDNALSWVAAYISNPEAFIKQQACKLSATDETLASIVWKGGYPGLITLTEDLYPDALNSYFHTYIERDVRLLSEVSDLQEFTRFVQLCANLTAQEIQFSELGRDIGISPHTSQRWLNLLISTYQWTDIPAYAGNTIKRISKKNKGYFIDSALACHLMHISSPNALLSHPKLGALFETYVVNDILRQLPLVRGNPAIYHWRTHAGAEVDLLLELDNVYYPIEIKCKKRPTVSDLSGIKAFRETYPKLNIAPALVICSVDKIMPITHDCYAVPFNLTGVYNGS
jgi:predicted AAA+ superfamily ATPase